MKGFKWIKLLLITVMFSSIVAACSSSNNELQTVRVAEVTRSIFYAPLYVAIKGLF